jgi:cleavage and polyadenylation specificity factor subunit 2
VELIDSQENGKDQQTENNQNARNAPQSNVDENMDVDERPEVASKSVRMDTAADSDELCLEILPSNNIPSHEAVFVNDPKLSDLRVFLNRSGFSAEFSAGVLYVNDVLRISRNQVF